MYYSFVFLFLVLMYCRNMVLESKFMKNTLISIIYSYAKIDTPELFISCCIPKR